MAPATPITGANHNPPVICGIATGQHFYMDVGGSSHGDVTVAFAGSATGTSRLWNVKVSQIPCGVDYAPPIQCGQWFTGVSGNVKSFNFDVTSVTDVMFKIGHSITRILRNTLF